MRRTIPALGRGRWLALGAVALSLLGCGSLLCPAADPGDQFCGMCSQPANCFYCPNGTCPADPCRAVCDSSAATGGGTTGGGSSGPYCYSTSACIPSTLSNTCECGGATSPGECVSGRPACIGVGGTCGNGTACCVGETCIKGRCVAGCGECAGKGCR